MSIFDVHVGGLCLHLFLVSDLSLVFWKAGTQTAQITNYRSKVWELQQSLTLPHITYKNASAQPTEALSFHHSSVAEGMM